MPFGIGEQDCPFEQRGDRWCTRGAQAQQKMAELQGSKLENLSEITATPTSQLKFITDAWCQVCAPYSDLSATAKTLLPGRVLYCTRACECLLVGVLPLAACM